MSCHGINAVNPVCRIRQAATAATHDAFSNIAGWFAQAAGKATTWLWQQLDSATSINLASPQLATDLAVTGAIAAVLCLGLFVLQVITATVRREPGALGRAVKGLIIALLASAFALAATRTLLGAVDALSDSVVRYAMNTNMAGLGRQLQLANLTSGGIANPAAMLLFSIVVLGAVVVVWAAMMIRKMMIIIAAVLAPLAFSGATADITRSWVRRWIEFMAAMIVSKLLLVIIMMVGISVVEGAGQAGSGVGQGATQLATGSLILLMGGFAPWVAIKMFHFTGDALAGAHAVAAQAPAGAATMIAAPQKMHALHTATTTALAGRGSPAGGVGAGGDGVTSQSDGPARDSADAIYDKVAQRPATDTGTGTAGEASSPTLAAGSGNTTAAGPAAGGAGSGSTAAAGGAAGGASPGAATTGAASAAGAAGVVAAPAAVAGAARRVGTAAGQAAGNAAPPATGSAELPPETTPGVEPPASAPSAPAPTADSSSAPASPPPPAGAPGPKQDPPQPAPSRPARPT